MLVLASDLNRDKVSADRGQNAELLFHLLLASQVVG